LNYGKIGHFSSNCPYPKEKDNDDEEAYNQKEHKKNYIRKRKTFILKKTLAHLT
jgi:hypothetical protein